MPLSSPSVPVLRRGGLREALQFSRLNSGAGASGGADDIQTTTKTATATATTVDAIATSATNKYAMAAKAKIAARAGVVGGGVLSPRGDNYHLHAPPRPPSSPISMVERNEREVEE